MRALLCGFLSLFVFNAQLLRRHEPPLVVPLPHHAGRPSRHAPHQRQVSLVQLPRLPARPAAGGGGGAANATAAAAATAAVGAVEVVEVISVAVVSVIAVAVVAVVVGHGAGIAAVGEGAPAVRLRASDRAKQ